MRARRDGLETAALGLFGRHCRSGHPAALSLKGNSSICVNPWAAGATVGNKHYHWWEWLDIDTVSLYSHRTCHCRLAENRGVGKQRR